MLSTLKTKIIFFISLIMAVTAAVNVLFANRDAGNAMLKAQRESARNLLHFVTINTGESYKNLLRDKIEMNLEKKATLKNDSAVVLSVLKGYLGGPEQDEGEDSLMWDKALEWFREAPLGETESFLFDGGGGIIARSNPGSGAFSPDTLTDLKGRNIGEAMRWDRLAPRGDFAVFRMAKSRRLGYFLPFPEKRCTLSVTLDIEDIEAEVDKKRKKIIAVIDRTTKKIKVADSGYIFMFNGNGDFLIHPPEGEEKMIIDADNTLSGRPLLTDLMTAARGKGGNLSYLSGGAPDAPAMESYSAFFKPLDWYITVTVPLAEIRGPARSIVLKLAAVIFFIFLASIFFTFLLVTHITSPLNLLASYAKALPEQDFTTGTEEKTPIDHLPKRHNDEVGRLAASFIFMTRELRKNIENLVSVTAARERIKSELGVAREIQMGIIPKTFPSFPDRPEFDLYATLEPAKEVGGDLYDFFALDDHRICITLGDVSDKGVPAALFMVITRTLIKNLSEGGGSPSEVMFAVNNILGSDNPRAMFVTLIIGILDTRTGRLSYVNGGHNPPIIISANGEVRYKKEISGPMVGVMEGIPYKELSVDLSPGDGILLYTDGVTEAMNPANELFTDERLITTVAELHRESPRELIDRVMGRVAEHADGAPQSDDIAMLMVRYHG